MSKNVGGTDKAIRFILGLGFLSLYFFLSGPAKYLSLIGLIPILTALIGWCPLYPILGINTCSKCAKK